MPYVAESLVVDEDNKLIALIYLDLENASKQGITTEELESLMDSNIKSVNDQLPSYSQISRVKVYMEEFEKTPKRSIKRYLYTRK